MGFRVGIDWGGTRHAVCVVDEAYGTIAARFEVAHTAAGLAELERRLAKFGPPSATPVAIERPSGLLVETLIDKSVPRGLPVQQPDKAWIAIYNEFKTSKG